MFTVPNCRACNPFSHKNARSVDGTNGQVRGRTFACQSCLWFAHASPTWLAQLTQNKETVHAEADSAHANQATISQLITETASQVLSLRRIP